jgi:RimJ/RimL family protein N-acetyltransferase
MIIGDGIRLRAIDKEDINLSTRWLNDPDVRRYLAFYVPFSKTHEEKWFENLSNLPITEHPLVMEIEQKSEWKPIGVTGFDHVDSRALNAELGIFIGEKEFWGRGIGTKAITLMLDYGFFTLNFHRIYLRVFEKNQRGIHCYEKIGFKHEGRMREAGYLDGKYMDVLWMGILQDEWREREQI